MVSYLAMTAFSIQLHSFNQKASTSRAMGHFIIFGIFWGVFFTTFQAQSSTPKQHRGFADMIQDCAPALTAPKNENVKEVSPENQVNYRYFKYLYEKSNKGEDGPLGLFSSHNYEAAHTYTNHPEKTAFTEYVEETLLELNIEKSAIDISREMSRAYSGIGWREHFKIMQLPMEEIRKADKRKQKKITFTKRQKLVQSYVPQLNQLLKNLLKKFLADPYVPIEIFFEQIYLRKDRHKYPNDFEAHRIILETMEEMELSLDTQYVPKYLTESTEELDGTDKKDFDFHLKVNGIDLAHLLNTEHLRASQRDYLNTQKIIRQYLPKMDLFLRTLKQKFLTDPEVPIQVFMKDTYLRPEKATSRIAQAYIIIGDTMKEIDLDIQHSLVPEYYIGFTENIEAAANEDERFDFHLKRNGIDLEELQKIEKTRVAQREFAKGQDIIIDNISKIDLMLQLLKYKFLADHEVPVQVFMEETYLHYNRRTIEEDQAYTIIKETMDEVGLDIEPALVPEYHTYLEVESIENFNFRLKKYNIDIGELQKAEHTRVAQADYAKRQDKIKRDSPK